MTDLDMTAPTLIPDDLVGLVAERRVIPFIGAGFSATMGHPSWDELLRKVAAHVDGALPYDDLKRYTNDDPLQIAEYLYLKEYERIGPLRHVIEQALPTGDRPSRSGPHVELVNLGAPQIYTTNYDDLIEGTFRDLGLAVDVITLPRDVATARSDVTQVVKYHGDLRHDETLVLTESSYYRRLDFESPMDLKFRSDLLGRSVLFMGYSFRDINIRIIWFKLMQMMKDIPQSDRRPSYIVRLDPNPVLEDLDKAVGLRTIVLDPAGKADSTAKRAALLSDFLYQLGLAACPEGTIPGGTEPMFLSSQIVRGLRVDFSIERIRRSDARRPRRPFADQFRFTSRVPSRRLAALLDRRIPEALVEDLQPAFEGLLHIRDFDPHRWRAILRLYSYFGPSDAFTSAVAFWLLHGHSRRVILETIEDRWPAVWASKVEPTLVRTTIDRLRAEIDFSKGDGADEDIAYVVDIAKRLLRRDIIEELLPADEDQLVGLLKEAAEVYPAIDSYDPPVGGPPAMDELLRQIAARAEEIGVDDEDLEFEPEDEYS